MIGVDVVRSAGRLTAKYGRMTWQDATELAAVFAQVAGRQARDAVTAARARAPRARPPR